MKDSLIMEIEGYFWDELSRLKRKLAVKEEEYNKIVNRLRSLPFASRLERVLKPFLKYLLPRKVKKLGKEIAGLREKIKQHKQAGTELEQGEYRLALILLDQLADRFFCLSMPALYPGFDGADGTNGLYSGSIFFKIIDLKKELDARMRGKIVESTSK